MSAATQGVVQMSAEGTGGLKLQLKHGPSGVTLQTDAPKDNGGEASSFSPTDLLAASLGACALTTMALAARRGNVPWGQTAARIEKRMSAAPRRVAEVLLELTMPRELPADQRARFEEIARTCPVARSLHPDVKVPMTFRYP